MKISGYVALNCMTKEVFVPKELEGSNYGWLFTSLDELQDYMKSEQLVLNEYIIHTVTDDVYILDVTSKKLN